MAPSPPPAPDTALASQQLPPSQPSQNPPATSQPDSALPDDTVQGRGGLPPGLAPPDRVGGLPPLPGGMSLSEIEQQLQQTIMPPPGTDIATVAAAAGLQDLAVSAPTALGGLDADLASQQL